MEFLQDDVELDWFGGHFRLGRRDCEVRHPLSGAEALALDLLGAFGDAKIALAHADHLGSGVAGALERVLDRYRVYLGAGRPRQLNPEAWGERLRHTVPVSQHRLAAPASITWMVTLECNRRCPYCFYKILPVDGPARHAPRDATFTAAAARRMIAEMARIGTGDLYLTGGEPLLREDLVDLIAEAAAHRIRCHIVSKFPIHDDLAAALAQAGLHHLTISLDTLDATHGRRLTGADDYPAEAIRAIDAALAAGLDLEVNAVLTAQNEDDIVPLAEALAARGVPRFTLSPLQPPYFRNARVDHLMTVTRVAEILDRLRARGASLILEQGGPTPADQAGHGACGPDLVCEIGLKALDVLPNGDLTRCHYLPERADLVMGSLERQSIMQVWTGAPLAALVTPTRDSYANTGCEGCGGFSACNSRGRCIASAILDHDQVFAPDAFCTAEPA